MGAGRRHRHHQRRRLPGRLRDGRVVDTASAYNEQIACGDDVISRIIYAQRGDGLERLQRLVVETINDLLVELQRRNQHRALRDPRGLAGRQHHDDPPAPRPGPASTSATSRTSRPSRRRPSWRPASSACASTRSRASTVMPSVGSYVGGDITAGVLSSGMFATDKLTLFIDIGTNGEMVLGNKDWLMACACSAGPAFEGGGVRNGMRATAGAIEDVYIADDTWEPTFRTIDDAPAVGICGSGLIDLLGELFVTGLLDKSGHLNLEAADRSHPRARRCARIRRGRRRRRRRRPGHRPHRVGHQQPDPRQGRDLCRLLGAVPQRRGGPRRRRADPDRRGLRPVHQRREGHPHRPAARPAGGTLQVPRQHQRPGRLRGAALREHAPRGRGHGAPR